MKDKLKILIKLQACDSRIDEITEQKNEAPLKIERLKAELESLEATFAETSERFQTLVKERRRIEKEIEEFETKIQKSNTKLSNIKSNKEYAAALKEIEDLNSIKFESEESLLHVMEEMETVEAQEKANQVKKKGLQQKYEKDKGLIETELLALDEELKTLQERNLGLSQVVDQDLLKRYLFLKKRKGGQAISAVVEGICQTCHMGIPPQKFRELLKGDALMSCPHCNRMIYWGEDEHFQNAKSEV